MSKITPHLWFDTQATEAAEFYSEVFPDSHVDNVTTLRDTPSGDCDVVSFTVWGHEFMAISAGPLFEINPSISFIVNFDPKLGSRCGAGPRPDLGAARRRRQRADATRRVPVLQALRMGRRSLRRLLAADPVRCSRRPTADDRAVAVVHGRRVRQGRRGGGALHLGVRRLRAGQSVPYPEGAEPDEPGTTMFSDFRLADGWFAAMDSAREHDFGFNEAVSLMISCSDQAEIDHYWERLSAVPEAEQCGWLKDRFGVSWQVVPAAMDEMMAQGTPRADRPGHPGVPADEEVRPGGLARRLRGRRLKRPVRVWLDCDPTMTLGRLWMDCCSTAAVR